MTNGGTGFPFVGRRHSRRRLAALWSCGKGTIAVEFGLIAPVMLVLLLGVLEVSSAISSSLAVQGAARTGSQYGLTRPPIQGDVSGIIAATRAALPQSWASDDAASTKVNATVACECEVTGAIACGGTCAAGEQMMSYLKVDVARIYKPIVALRYFSTGYEFKNSSQVRLK